MGAAASQEQPPQGVPRPPPLGPRPTNTRIPTPFEPSLLRDSRREIRPVEYRLPVLQSHIVRNVVSLNRATLTLVPLHDVYLVQFDFTAEVEGFITIYYVAEQIIHRGGVGESAPVRRVSYVGHGEKPGKTKFAIGDKQRYRQNLDKALDVRRFSNSQLTYKQGGTYPLVIRLEACYDQSAQIPEYQRVKSQTTFAELINVDGVYQIQVISQQVLVDGTIYRMQDMYGIGATDVTAKANEDDAYEMDTSHECVICLTEPSNTAVQPCNHLCLCDECARILGSETEFHRRKCPVCRTQLMSFLRIITAAPSDESVDTSTGVEASASSVDASDSNATHTGATTHQTIAITDTSPAPGAPGASTAAGLVSSRVSTVTTGTPRHEGSTIPSGANAV